MYYAMQLLPLFSIFSLLLLMVFRKNYKLIRSSRKFNSPPSPSKLPLIGNLHQLGSLPHRSLHFLAQKHGPLMLLHLGQVPTLVVSSASAAREILRTHDLFFSNRPDSRVTKRFLSGKDMGFAPYGEYWRQVRRICVLKLLSAKRVKSFRSVREEEVDLMAEKIEHISSSSTLVDLSEMLVLLTSNVICRVALGVKNNIDDGGGGRRIKEMMSDFEYLLGVFNIADFIPSLAWVNNLNGLNAKVEKSFSELNRFLDGIVEEKLEKKKKRIEGYGYDSGHDAMSGGKEENLLNVLLHVEDDSTFDVHLGKDNIKAIILDMFTGGTDTTYAVIEWAMAELIRHPEIMKEAQEEVRRISEGKSMVTEDDTEKMPYLKAVIKETLRIHPPAPLLMPRESMKDIKVNGYDIQDKTTVIINAWSIGRDPCSWEEPQDFRPRRFMECYSNDIDFKGHDFQFIPFGAGRRGCPGITFAISTIELALANLLNRFDWAMPCGMDAKDLDMDESFGMTVHKKENLVLAAVPTTIQTFSLKFLDGLRTA